MLAALSENIKFITPLLTVLGWGFVLYNTNRSSKRSETRSQCDKCIDKLEKLISDSNKYVKKKNKEKEVKVEDLNKNDDYDYQDTIRLHLMSLEQRSKYLKKRTANNFICLDEIAKIRNLSVNYTNYEEIEEIALDMIENIEETYNECFLYGIRNILHNVLKVIGWTCFWVISGVLVIYTLV
ncbi:hypothetical protein C9J41_20670 [Photobacterium sp. GB-50]|uniref:hypothetical protein n=1 Tax=Photobacterium sp. GB-50 TaxID=2022107 RepID=UPI000D177D48|nr:hypothetical protein [Photobacterium sp. GB-50]PSW70020.1 hypothetical protein C9J41_20670 [Photobacterium sp. GB-50]